MIDERKEKDSRQPCWHCAKYIDGCSWSREGKPVDGWDAVRTYAHQQVCLNGEKMNIKLPFSYMIKHCPEYELEKTRCYPGTMVPLGIEIDSYKAVMEGKRIYGYTSDDIAEVLRQRTAYKPERHNE